jgi:hypothetical protein
VREISSSVLFCLVPNRGMDCNRKRKANAIFLLLLVMLTEILRHRRVRSEELMWSSVLAGDHQNGGELSRLMVLNGF